MTPEQVINAHQRALRVAGELVILRRTTGTNPQQFFDAKVMARVRDYAPHEMVDGIQQGDRLVEILALDLDRGQFPGPIKSGQGADAVRLKRGWTKVQSVDDQTKRIQGVLITYRLQVRG